ncbi:MAG: XisI protein [Chthonomonadaceae bacterium]|nr:XisI protein [Chthonomonadaceae bacterium]
MDRICTYRALILKTLQEIADLYRNEQSAHIELVCDEERGHYHLGEVGWEGDRRIDSMIVHLDLIGEKIWIQRNATEIRVAEELIRAGVSKQHIVLGFQHPDRRPDTDYATA